MDEHKKYGIIYFVACAILSIAAIFSIMLCYSEKPKTLVEVQYVTPPKTDFLVNKAIEETNHKDAVSPVPVKHSVINEMQVKPNYVVNVDIPQTDLEMLACAIYNEQGADMSCDLCRYRVGDVILTRVADPRFPDTIHGVLTQKYQYGLFWKTGVVWPSRAASGREWHAVERAYAVAYDLLNNIRHSDLYGKGYIWQAEFRQGSDSVHCCGTYYEKG